MKLARSQAKTAGDSVPEGGSRSWCSTRERSGMPIAEGLRALSLKSIHLLVIYLFLCTTCGRQCYIRVIRVNKTYISCLLRIAGNV